MRNQSQNRSRHRARKHGITAGRRGRHPQGRHPVSSDLGGCVMMIGWRAIPSKTKRRSISSSRTNCTRETNGSSDVNRTNGSRTNKKSAATNTNKKSAALNKKGAAKSYSEWHESTDVHRCGEKNICGKKKRYHREKNDSSDAIGDSFTTHSYLDFTRTSRGFTRHTAISSRGVRSSFACVCVVMR